MPTNSTDRGGSLHPHHFPFRTHNSSHYFGPFSRLDRQHWRDPEVTPKRVRPARIAQIRRGRWLSDGGDLPTTREHRAAAEERRRLRDRAPPTQLRTAGPLIPDPPRKVQIVEMRWSWQVEPGGPHVEGPGGARPMTVRPSVVASASRSRSSCWKGCCASGSALSACRPPITRAPQREVRPS